MAEESEKTSFSGKLIYIVLVLVVAVAAGVSWYFYSEYQKAQALLKNPSTALAQNDKEIIQKVSKLIELPDEKPTLAEVSDKGKLASQPFFSKAENGDKVLIFSNAKKAVLYRPSTNKIIEVGPVTIPSPGAEGKEPEVAGAQTTPGASVTPSTTAQQTVAVALYNGTTTVGLTNKVEKQLTDAKAPAEVILKDNAAVKTYTQTLVVDLSGKAKVQAEAIAKLVKGKVGTLPTGENKPDPADSDGKTAQILVILGSDYTK